MIDKSTYELTARSDDQLYAATRGGELLTIDTETGQGTKVGVYRSDLDFKPDGIFIPSAVFIQYRMTFYS